MNNKNEMMAQVIAEQCVRARHAETLLQQLRHTIDALGVVLWETDRDLRLVHSYGSSIADSFVDRHVEEFYRDVYGIDEANAAPLTAHRDAQRGRSATVAWQDGIRRYAMIVEPKRDAEGEIVGTVGMSLRLSE